MFDKITKQFYELFASAYRLLNLDGGQVIAINLLIFLTNYFGSKIFFDNIENTTGKVLVGLMLVCMINITGACTILFRLYKIGYGERINLIRCISHIWLSTWRIAGFYLWFIPVAILIISPFMALIDTKLWQEFSVTYISMISPFITLSVLTIITTNLSSFRTIGFILKSIKTRKLEMSTLVVLGLLYSAPTLIGITKLENSYALISLLTSLWILYVETMVVGLYLQKFPKYNSIDKKQEPDSIIVL